MKGGKGLASSPMRKQVIVHNMETDLRSCHENSNTGKLHAHLDKNLCSTVDGGNHFNPPQTFIKEEQN